MQLFCREEKGQMIQIDISPKKIQKWPISMGKLLNIISHQGNANQNHNEISPLICQHDIKKNTNVGEDVEKWEHIIHCW